MSVLLLGAANIWGQSAHKLTGKILSTKNQPVEGPCYGVRYGKCDYFTRWSVQV